MLMLSLSTISRLLFVFFFNDTATTEIYTLSLHDALPISARPELPAPHPRQGLGQRGPPGHPLMNEQKREALDAYYKDARSEEHTSELQSRLHLVCRLLLEKKKKQQHTKKSTQKARTQRVS